MTSINSNYSGSFRALEEKRESENKRKEIQSAVVSGGIAGAIAGLTAANRGDKFHGRSYETINGDIIYMSEKPAQFESLQKWDAKNQKEIPLTNEELKYINESIKTDKAKKAIEKAKDYSSQWFDSRYKGRQFGLITLENSDYTLLQNRGLADYLVKKSDNNEQFTFRNVEKWDFKEYDDESKAAKNVFSDISIKEGKQYEDITLNHDKYKAVKNAFRNGEHQTDGFFKRYFGLSDDELKNLKDGKDGKEINVRVFKKSTNEALSEASKTQNVFDELAKQALDKTTGQKWGHGLGFAALFATVVGLSAWAISKLSHDNEAKKAAKQSQNSQLYA